MLDTFTTVNLRNFVPIGFYDKTVEDPVGTADKVGQGIKNAGDKAVDKVNDVGIRADQYFQVKKSSDVGDKTWVKGDPVEVTETPVDSTDKKVEESKPKTKKKKQTLQRGKDVFIAYADVKDVLTTEYRGLNTVDKEIIKAFSPILKTKIEGEDIIVYNNTDRVKEGLYIGLK